MKELKLNQETADAILEWIHSPRNTEKEGDTLGMWMPRTFLEIKTFINSLVVEDEIRAMTPLEHQWMDFKKILSELVIFQEDYEEQTKDTLPGNQYYSDKLMVIINRAKQAINTNTENKPLTDRAGDQWRKDLEHVAQLEQENKELRKCPDCGHIMAQMHINIKWSCPNCGYSTYKEENDAPI